MRHEGSAACSGRVVLCARAFARAEKRPRFDWTSDTWCHRAKLLPSSLPFEEERAPGMSRETPSCGRDFPPRPGLGAATRSQTCLARALGSFTASDEGCLRSLTIVRCVKELDGHSGSPQPVELTLRRDEAPVLRRAFTCSAGAPRGRECREAWTCERRSIREPCEDRDASGFRRPPRRIRVRTGRARWMTHAPPGAPDERRRAGRRSCAAAQTDGPCRGDLPTTRCEDLRGENTLVEPLPRPRTFSPHLPRRDPHALAGDRTPGWFSVADHPARAHRKRRFRWLFDSVIHVPPRARAAHRLSLAGSPSPSGEGRRGSFVGRAAGGRSPWPTGSVSHPSPVRVRRSRRGSGATRVTSTPRRACGRLRGGDLVSGLAKPPTAPTPSPE